TIPSPKSPTPKGGGSTPPEVGAARSQALSFTRLPWRTIKMVVMPGLVPGIHVLLEPAKDVDGRTKSGHDEPIIRSSDLNLPPRDLFLDIAQPIFAEENLVTDKESRAAERAARDRGFGVLQETLLDLGLLRASDKPGAVETGLLQRRGGDLR